MSIRADDPRLADFTPEEIARGLPEQIAKEEAAAGKDQVKLPDNVVEPPPVVGPPPVVVPPPVSGPGPRFYGENPELLAQLQTQLGALQGFTDPRAANLVGYGEADVQGFIEGRFSFEDVFGSLTKLSGLARQAVIGMSAGTPKPSPADEAFLAKQRSDAFSRLRSLLSRFGLGELEDAVRSIITSGMVDLESPDAIIFALRGEAAYKRRFAANAARLAAGLPELEPSTYVGLEESYRRLLQANGFGTDWYNDQTDFEKWIEGDVSPAELQERINQGYRMVADADPGVKAQMLRLYNVSDSDLAAYFLDPKRTAPLLTTRQRTRQAQAAGIAARGKEQGGIDLTADEAEELASRGITQEQALERFGEMGTLTGLYEQLTGEEKISRQQQLGATFRYNTKALDAVRKRQRQRLAEFEAGGQFARTSGATSGTVETGAGLAQ